MHQRKSHNSKCSAATLACLLLAVSTLALQSQTIVFKLRNGDRVSGNIVSENTNQVVISNAWTKTLAIPLVEVQEREILTPRIVAGTNAPVLSTNALVVKTNIPTPVASPALVTNPVKTKTPSAWHGDIQIGADVGISETRRQLYHGRFKITYAPVAVAVPGSPKLIDRFRNTFDLNTAYGTTDGILSANRMEGSSKTDFDLGEDRRMFVYNLFGGGYDEIRQIERRFEIGPGLGYHILTHSNLVLNAEVGLNYQTQQLWSKANSASPRVYTWNDNFYYRFAEDFTWRISKTLTFDEKFELFPKMNLEDYRFRFESNLRYWILENLSFNLTVLDIYDTQPAKNVGKNDLQIRSSVGVKF